MTRTPFRSPSRARRSARGHCWTHSRRTSGFAMEYVRLADPEAAPAVPTGCSRARASSGRPARCRGSAARGRQRALQSTQIALELLSALLLLCATPIVATLVSERILARGRELAILRAGGLTPGGIVMLNGIFYGVLGALGGLLGLIGGTSVSPWVAGRPRSCCRRRRPSARPRPPRSPSSSARRSGRAAAAVPAWLLSRRPAAEALAAEGGGRRDASRLARVARRARLPWRR